MWGAAVALERWHPIPCSGCLVRARAALSCPNLSAFWGTLPQNALVHGISSMAATPAKRARTPACKPPFLILWGQIDLADSIVTFMGMKTLAKVPIICRSLRAAHPLILFKAARRLKVLDRAQDAFMRVLRTVSRERYCFRETWTEGLTRWQISRSFHPSGLSGLRADTVGSPPHLRLRGSHGGHRGLSHQFSRTAGRYLAVQSFRAQVTFPSGVAKACGYVWLVSPLSNLHVIGGIYGTYRGEDDSDMEEVAPADRVGVLAWVARKETEPGEFENVTTELCTVTPGVCYEVTASFSVPDDDRNKTTTVTVAQHGQPPFATYCILCRAGELDEVRIYNFRDGEAHIGEIEVNYTGPS